jgi:hypothetical protein
MTPQNDGADQSAHDDYDRTVTTPELRKERDDDVPPISVETANTVVTLYSQPRRLWHVSCPLACDE